jgi:M6 family metalloprotease-like protein
MQRLPMFALGAIAFAALLGGTTSSVAVGSSVQARFVTERGWVRPGESYIFTVRYVATDAASASLALSLPPSAYFVSSTPAPASSTAHSASYDVAGQAGQIVVTARAATHAEDPEVVWKNISATAELTADGQAFSSRTNGPHVTEHSRARLGDRPFPVVNVMYQDIRRCNGPGDPFDECAAAHPVDALDEIMNSRTLPTSVWRHYNDLSLGKLNPQGTVAAAGKGTVPFAGLGQHKFARLAPNGTCSGTTFAGPAQPQGAGTDSAGTGGQDGTPGLYPNRIVDGWYLLPGTQGFYGGDSTGHALAGALTGVGLLFGVDDGCGPTAKLAYDAASLADPDLDYNDFDSDRNGVVDFFEVIFAGDGGNGHTTVTGLNNVWPHSFSLEYQFEDANGQKGYVSNDQLRDRLERPLWWTDATRKQMTTTNMGDALKVWVRVGPYNVNPESAFDFTSVISHEYGHSLGLPDFYSTGTRSTFGTWELMAADHSQFMTGYTRQALGWVVPRTLTDGEHTLRESKFDTGSIVWRRQDGTLYELTGPDVRNADLLRVPIANPPLIDEVPDGTFAAFSGAGNDFNCAPEEGHGMLISLPDMELAADATAVKLKFKTLFEMEWDWDYGFVLVSTDGGSTWQSLPSQKGTTIQNNWNPNNTPGATGAECHAKFNNGITGVSGQPNTVANPDRQAATVHYEPAVWIDDEYDLTAFKGQYVLVALTYATDPAEVKRGWFVDSLSVEVTRASGTSTLYATSFEEHQLEQDRTRLFPLGKSGWGIVNSAAGQPQDHAYYIELRDRISWDFDGKGENDRGPITWQPGVSMVYTQETRGWGNTRCIGDMPCQTPVDSVPQPGNENPNLNDAAFITTGARAQFNGCTHIDNYVDPDGPDENWKLPPALKFLVTGITGLSGDGSVPASPAQATLIADVYPDCAQEILAPDPLEVTGYENPDTDGTYTLTWPRPAGAAGPDTLQEATIFEVLLEDDAEGGLGQWVTSTQGSGAFAWEVSGTKTNGGASAFWGRYANGSDAAQTGNKPATMLTLKDAILIPDVGSTSLVYWDFHVNEGDDSVILEATTDNGATWQTISQSARSALAPDAAAAIATEPMTRNEFPLDAFKGQSLKLRFRMQSGGEDRAGSAPLGWYVDDIRIETSNFSDLVTTASTSVERTGKPTGDYYYRVKTRYPAGPASFESPWSNVVEVNVQIPVNALPQVDAGTGFTMDEGTRRSLKGTATDADGDTLTIAWTQTAGPSVSDFTGTDTLEPSFTAPMVDADTPLTFTLSVSDGKAPAVTDTVTVTVHDLMGGTPGGGNTIGNNSVGGALPPLTLLALGLLALRRRRGRH